MTGPRSRYPGIDPELIAAAAHEQLGPRRGSVPAGKWSGVNKAQGRRAPGSMNSVEKKRAKLLEQRRVAGAILGWWYQPAGLRLGRGCFYHPDFVVQEEDGTITLEEVKGTAGWSLDSESRTKFVAAAERYPCLRFRGVVLNKDGSWKADDYDPRAASPSPEAT